MRIAFYDTHMGIRGTSVAMYDYANYNEELLNNTSIIIIPQDDRGQNDPLGIEKFTTRFPVFRYKTLEELEKVLEDEKCDVLYCIKYGTNDGIFSKRIKTVIHCVFDMTQPHGNIYAGVSEALATKYNQSIFVPHMISLEPSTTGENMRKQLGIPEDAIVFGRYGGYDTMNLLFCWRAIKMIVSNFPNIYFLFANTPERIIHPNVKYVPKMIKNEDKNRFIQTCDAHIECGSMGHSFGLAIAEFSVNNKPIIAYYNRNINISSIWNDSHIKILGNKGIYFSDERDFFHILTTFDPSEYKGKDMNCYREYTPQKVMQIFKEVFLD